MPSKRYRVVFVDWYGTLSVSNFWGHFENPSHERHALFSRIEKTLFVENRELLIPWMTGKLNSEQVLRVVSDKLGLSYEMLFEEFVASCKEMRLVSDQALPLVKSIRSKGVRVVIATDNMDCFSRWTVPALKLEDEFDAILDSFRLKALKDAIGADGESLFFGRYLASSGISPQQAVLVDDSETSRSTARAIGIDYIHVIPGMGLVPALQDVLKRIDLPLQPLYTR